MRVIPCRTYHAKTIGRSLLRMPDGKSVFKLYYISVIGRNMPEQYEWQRCPRNTADFERTFRAGDYEGIGFVIAFPHVTKVYRFSPEGETILDVREFNTEGMTHRDCSRRDGYHELACYAEAAIAADEYRAWAEAATVHEYLASHSDAADFPVLSHTKLAAYWDTASRLP
jgi:hypothetical protein